MCWDVSIQMKPCDVGDEVRTVEGVAGETWRTGQDLTVS